MDGVDLVKNPLLIGVGAFVVLAAIASLGGRQVGALTAQAAEQAPDEVRWRGGFDCKSAYEGSDIVFHNGSSYVAKEPVAGCVEPPESPWELIAPGGEQGSAGGAGAKGAPGPAGRFAGAFRSPDGRFEVSVTNAGINLIGPDASVEVTQAGVRVVGDGNLLIDAGATTAVRASATAAVNGGFVTLGGSSCGQVARKDVSIVQATFGTVWWPGGPNSIPWPDGPMTSGFIVNGSTKVQAC